MKKLLMILTILLLACSKEDEEDLISENITITRVFDIGNNGNASDIRIEFEVLDPNVGDFQIIVSKESSFGALNLELIQNLGDNQYLSVGTSSETEYREYLPASLLDSDGDSITNDVNYNIVIYTVESQKLSSPFEGFSLKNESVINGEYIGLWNDNLYTDFGISAVITGSGSTFRGDFYYTSNFTSCCGGQTDGSISFQVVDGEILSFRYNQDLIDFMGGCPGLYNGSGEVVNDFDLLIDFEGEDCEGPHTGGKISLRKRF